jgi:F-type H+-transporting ATPase subunit alpha
MKQVAGRLRLELAQYREMAAFAKFGSDLDKSTLALLARGSRLTELLKQDLYHPYPVEQQVVLMFAGTNGFIDGYPESAIGKYETAVLAFMKDHHAQLMADIKEKREISPAIQEQLTQALTTFKEQFTY